MQIALGISVAVHVVLLSVRFVYPELRKLSSTVPLDVILVNSKSATKPLSAEALAQANLDGGGNTDQNHRIKTPLPFDKSTDQAQEQQLQDASKMRQQLEAEAQKLMTRIKSTTRLAQPDVKTNAPPQPESGLDNADVIQQTQALARLEGQISKEWDAYQKKPRKQFIGARAQEYRFARYVEAWRQKIERVGARLYPDEARREKIYGTLQMTVEIKADGSIASVEINHSSGKKILDDAARRIVYQAAPFPPFPPEVRKDSDVISITRTWTFTTSDKLEYNDE